MNLGELIKRSKRILIISRKPSSEEFAKVAKVTAFGAILIGVIGMLVSVVLGFI